MRAKLLAPMTLGLVCVSISVQTTAAQGKGACDLPQALEHEITARYPGSRIVNVSDLSEYNRALFRKDHDNSCPGLVKVDFYGDGRPTLALVLTKTAGAKEEAELVLAHELRGQWKTTVVDKAEGAPVPVVWSQPPALYRDVDGKKEIRATRQVVVFAGYESWAIVYAWTGKGVSKVWIAD